MGEQTISMDKEGEVIDKLIALVGGLSPLCRDKVSHVYLSQFGSRIIPFCRKHFHICNNADARVDFLRWVIEYAKNNAEVVAFAIEAIGDRSAKVRRYACLVLACSGDNRAIPILTTAASATNEPTSTDARNAIAAIQSQDWYLFHRSDPSNRTYVLPMPHNPDYPEGANVNHFIEKACPKVVADLERILGNIYVKWKDQQTA